MISLAAASARLALPGPDRLGRVLEDVVSTCAIWRGRRSAAQDDRQGRDVAISRVAVALEKQRLLAEFLASSGCTDRARHAGERGELVDHAADVADLAMMVSVQIERFPGSSLICFR